MKITKEQFVNNCLKSVPTTKESAEYLYSVYCGCVLINGDEGKASLYDFLYEWMGGMIQAHGIGAISPIGFVLGTLDKEVLSKAEIEMLSKEMQSKLLTNFKNKN